MRQARTASKYLLTIFMIVAGTMHFVNPAFFLKIMPPYLPLHQELVLLSGIFEVVLGVLLLVPQTSRTAAWGIVSFADCCLSSKPVPLPASGDFSGIAYHSLTEASIAGPVHSLGILEYKTGQ